MLAGSKKDGCTIVLLVGSEGDGCTIVLLSGSEGDGCTIVMLLVESERDGCLGARVAAVRLCCWLGARAADVRRWLGARGTAVRLCCWLIIQYYMYAVYYLQYLV